MQISTKGSFSGLFLPACPLNNHLKICSRSIFWRRHCRWDLKAKSLYMMQANRCLRDLLLLAFCHDCESSLATWNFFHPVTTKWRNYGLEGEHTNNLRKLDGRLKVAKGEA
ncbi:hypothetical protein EGM_11152 [Macaca fascicularis]|uniref:Uncharacterized protein n=1 Tax=Macaca fascicularis TaxID=9541 RepID=G7NY97_MACFA|nr:hypothetical protein EGM_11152 [Macaca fascicularis]